jgi:hypothetical protein
VAVHATDAALARVDHGDVADMIHELERVGGQKLGGAGLGEVGGCVEERGLIGVHAAFQARVGDQAWRHEHVHQINLVTEVELQEDGAAFGRLRVGVAAAAGHVVEGEAQRARYGSAAERAAEQLHEASSLKRAQIRDFLRDSHARISAASSVAVFSVSARSKWPL